MNAQQIKAIQNSAKSLQWAIENLRSEITLLEGTLADQRLNLAAREAELAELTEGLNVDLSPPEWVKGLEG